MGNGSKNLLRASSLFGAFLCVFLLITGCATVVPERISPSPGDPVARFPKILVGDAFVISDYSPMIGRRDVFRGTVTEAGKDGSFVVEVKGEKTQVPIVMHYNAKYQVVKVLLGEKEYQDINSPPALPLDFPLFVGKKWSDEYKARSVAGSICDYKNNYQVVAYERVTVKAGSFMAFKISQSQQNLTSRNFHSATLWYSPEAKSIVRADYGWKPDMEMLSFSLAKVDTEPPTITVTSPKYEKDPVVIQSENQLEIKGHVRDEGDIKSFKINQSDISLSQFGEFVYFSALNKGENNYEMIACDAQGNEATKTLRIRYEPPDKIPSVPEPKIQASMEKPACWVLSIGVSKYKAANLSLKYAHLDAMSIANIMKDQEGKLFSEVFVKTLTDEECTRNSILESLSKHLGKAAPSDVVFIFIAGHGVRHKQTGSYYFLTHGADSQNLISEGLRWSDFDEGLKIISGNVDKVILVLDTCHAGAMKTYIRGVEGGEDLLSAMKEATGLYILASSKSGEESMEDAEFRFPIEKGGHGAFTYALLKGLSGEANTDKDGYVSVHELFNFVAKVVPRITDGRQHPYSRITGTDMPIAVTGRGK